MGGTLEGLGRGNAFSHVNNLVGTAINLKKMQNDEDQRAQENAINLEKLGMMKDQQAVDMRIKSAQMKEVEEKAKSDATPYDITVDPRFMSLPPEAQKTVLDHATKNKYTDQAGLGTRRSAKQLLTDMEGKSELFTSAFGPVVESKKQATVQAFAALQEAKVKGDPKKIQQAQADFDKASMAYQSTQAGFTTHLSRLEETRAKQEGRIEKGPGGGLYRRKEDGTLEELVAPPEKEAKIKGDVHDFGPYKQAGYFDDKGKFVPTGEKVIKPREDASDRAETREEKRKVKALGDARKEMEKIYGYSQFLPTAQDPLLIEKVGKGKMLVEDIIDNYKDHGLSKEPTPGKAAEMAKRIVDKLYNPAPVPPAKPAGNPIRKALGLE